MTEFPRKMCHPDTGIFLWTDFPATTGYWSGYMRLSLGYSYMIIYKSDCMRGCDLLNFVYCCLINICQVQKRGFY